MINGSTGYPKRDWLLSDAVKHYKCTLQARATAGSASTGKNIMTIAKSLRQSAIKVIFAAEASAGRAHNEKAMHSKDIEIFRV